MKSVKPLRLFFLFSREISLLFIFRIFIVYYFLLIKFSNVRASWLRETGRRNYSGVENPIDSHAYDDVNNGVADDEDQRTNEGAINNGNIKGLSDLSRPPTSGETSDTWSDDAVMSAAKCARGRVSLWERGEEEGGLGGMRR